MGKNTTKKGKQKEPTSAVPANAPHLPVPPPSPPLPALVASPLAAHHIPYPSATIDTIQEEEVFRDQGGPAVGGEDGSWQDVGQSAADSWGADVPGNSNGDLGEDGWETDLAQAPIPMPSPQPPPKNSGGGKDAKPHHPQLQVRIPSNPQNLKGPTANTSAHKSSAGSWGYAQPRPLQGTWIPEEDEWSMDGRWGPGEDDDGDGWGTDGGGWSQQPHSAAWAHAVSAHSAHSQTPSHAPTTGWQSWGEEARRLPKVTFDLAIPPSPSSIRSKPVLSQTQRSQILDELLNNPQQNQQLYPMPANPHPPAMNITQNQHGSRHQQHHGSHRSYRQHHGQGSKNLGSEPRHQVPKAHPQGQSHDGRQQVHDAWGLGGGWNDEPTDDEEQDMPQDPWSRRVHFSTGKLRASMPPSSVPSVSPSAVVENITVNALPQNKLGISTIPMSKTLLYAYSGSTPSTESEPGRAAMQRITDFHFVESRGEALKGVQNAFYGKRKATDRFHWLFPPEKDERVWSLLNWINSMSFGIASFGLQKFLQTRERGALIVNAAYRPVHSPSEPAFDWITWNEIQRTMDRVLQESVGYYNPVTHIIVFVLLPSPSGNSVAIWRRKLPIPNNIRLAYQAQITQALASLHKDYPVLVDELPAPPEHAPPPPPPKKKRKWYKLWLFS